MPLSFTRTHLCIRFLLELCILASIGAWAASLPISLPERVALGGLACAGAATLWGLILSPKRRIELPAPIRLIIEAAFFLIAAAALANIGQWQLGSALLVTAIADRITLAVLR
jgi:hypothetical protein